VNGSYFGTRPCVEPNRAGRARLRLGGSSCHIDYSTNRRIGQRALRRGDLKYVRTEGADHLYDLAADVREQADLAARRPADLASLRSAWERIDAELLACSA